MQGKPKRVQTREIKVGNVTIGNSNPIVIQSMCNTDIMDEDSTLKQIEDLGKAGCQIARLAVPDEKAVEAFGRIKKQAIIPLVADIHFNYKLALGAIDAGADKIRINPGNIGSIDRVKAVVKAAQGAQIPIRIGVNSGSLEKRLLEKYNGPTPEALLESALDHIKSIEDLGFSDLVISIKASDVWTTIEACRLLSQKTNVPQHIGITESGTIKTGTIKSSVGVGTLLAEGIGDTIRISLAGDPINEIPVAREILKSLGLAKGPTVIACPTCGRTKISVEELATKIETALEKVTVPVKVAVMGCVVNGPGEAKDADIGVAGGKHEGLIFVKGSSVEKVPEDQIIPKLLAYVEKFAAGQL